MTTGNSLDDYQKRAIQFAVYPNRHGDNGEVYPVLGLNGEAGEVSEKVKKKIRDGIPDTYKQDMMKELGDCLWYIAATADELDLSLAEIAEFNLKKLQSRAERDTIHGSGDDR